MLQVVRVGPVLRSGLGLRARLGVPRSDAVRWRCCLRAVWPPWRSTSLEGVWRTGVRAVELETLMLVSSRGYPLLTMVNGPLMAWRSWPDSYRSRPVRAAATTSAPWCCPPFRALPGASSAWPLSGWTRPLLPPTRLLPNPGTDGFCQGRLRVYINHAPLTGSGCPTATDGLDRFRESQILLRRVGGRPPTFPPAYGRREAEPHRSRTVSLEIGQIAADEAAEQPTWETRSSRG